MLVFTDLDGTLLDHDTYSWEPAKAALEELKSAGIPVIFCTSKTRAESEHYRSAIGLADPFIVENGGAVFMPKGSFAADYPGKKDAGEYDVIELGTPYPKLREALSRLHDLGKIRGFGDISPEEIAQDTGLAFEQAVMAKAREYDEAFKFEGGAPGLQVAIKAMGLNWTRGGRYWHIMGNNDKGKAVQVLSDLYKTEDPGLKTVGLGDSLNDLPMLKSVDIPILVRRHDGTYDEAVLADKETRDRVLKTDLPGPAGWNAIMLDLLEKSASQKSAPL